MIQYTREVYVKIQEELKLVEDQAQNNNHFSSNSKGETFKSEYTLDDIVSLLLEKIYELAFPAIRQRYDIDKTQVTIILNEELDLKHREMINNSLKVYGKNSLTGFVKSVTITDRVSDEYVNCFLENNLHMLEFLDTYGLDHQALPTIPSLEQRFWDLSSENPDTNFIFYIRKLGTDAPSDLEGTIPRIYTADPSFRVYTIFTGIDENQILRNKKEELLQLLEINKLNRIPAVDYFVENDNGLVSMPHPICNALIANRVSKALSNNIYQSIRDNLVPYCASEDLNIRNEYLKNNVFHMNKLISSLISKDYLGNGFINIKHIEKCFTPALQPEVVKFKLMELLREMFELASIKWYIGSSGTGHWRTQQANIDRLQHGILGYSGTYNHQWNERFFSSYNKVFSKLSEEDFNVLFSTGEGLNDAIAIQQLINSFGKTLLGCKKTKELFTFPVNNMQCRHCNSSNCFRSILLQAYKLDELKQPNDTTRSSWLNMRCNFGDRFKQVEVSIYNLFIREFNRTILLEAKAHNARKASNVLKKNQQASYFLEQVKNAVNNLLNQYEGEISNIRIAEILQETK